MGLDWLAIGVFAISAVAYAFVPRSWRQWLLLGGSVAAIYWLQPNGPIRFSSYVLQTATLVLTVASWWLTRPRDEAPSSAETRQNWIALAVVAGISLVITLNRFLPLDWRVTAYRPPSPLAVLAAFAAIGLLFWLGARLLRRVNPNKLLTGSILAIVVIFVVLKTAPLASAVAAGWRALTGQDVTLASPSDLIWLGFSYVAFRLIHTMRDRQTGILPALTLREYVTYVIFFPSYIAGPIDRAERFVGDFRQVVELPSWQSSRFFTAGQRIAVGLFKKFVIADTLAMGMALDATNAAQADSTLGLWALLYGYGLRLYFDFAGYTDIAIGIGMLFGITLPENFLRPYLKTNITQFWQSWHKTLSDWARFYVFSPLSRSLLRRKPRPSPTLIVLVSQLATMIVIGLWHGVTLNFLIWGVWHGLALFAHKQWSDRTRKWYRGLKQKPWQRRAWTLLAWFLTFNYVMLGWVWFVIPDFASAVAVFGKLFGLSG